MSRYGMSVPLAGMSLADHQELFRELVDLGYTDVWSSEADGADGFTPLSLAAAWAPELRLGVAIIPAFTRGPALLAQSAASLADAAPGRLVPENPPPILVAALREGMLRLAGSVGDGAIINWLSADDVRTVAPRPAGSTSADTWRPVSPRRRCRSWGSPTSTPARRSGTWRPQPPSGGRGPTRGRGPRR